jgi:hypothetical protein
MNKLLIGLLVFGAALAPRLFLAVFHLEVASDAVVYGTVASNILTNGCVSLADPATGICTPHWGGNQFPGFPAFIAMVWFVFPESWIAVALLQGVVFSFAATYLWFSLDRYLNSPTGAMVSALVVALSPLSTPWARFILADTLSLAVVVVVTAELIRSLEQGKLRIPVLGVALCVGFFCRFDVIFLTIPVAITGFYLHSFAVAMRRGFAIFIILIIPVAAWSGRGIAKGLGPHPEVFFVASGHAPPMGYVAWAKTWATSQYQAPMWWYPIQLAKYSSISLPAAAYQTDDQKKQILGILAQLKNYDGLAFPKMLDARFLEFAGTFKTNHPLEYWLQLPLERLWNLWINPLNSAGWPVRVGWVNGIPETNKLIDIIISNPNATVVKGGTAAYRLALPLLSLLLLMLMHRSLSQATILLLSASMLYLIGRSVFLSWGFFIESRYLLQIFPVLETSLALGLFDLLRKTEHRQTTE